MKHADRPRQGLSILVSVLASLATATTAPACSSPEWPQFRGPNCGGVATDAHPPVAFGAQQNLRWKVDLPPGASSPVIAGDRIFLTIFETQHLATCCLRRTDGAMLWRQEAGAEKIEPFFAKYGSPAAPSCATDGERVVSYFGSCGLFCYDLEGHELWRVALPMILGDEFGTGNSPVIAGGRVLLLRDEKGEAQGLHAYDVRTGKALWRTSRKEFHASYSTPVIWDGCAVAIGDLRVKGYDLQTGAERFLLRGIAAYPCTTPVVGENGLLYVATWSNGSRNEPNPDYDELLAKYDKDKSGDLQFSELADSPLKDFAPLIDDNGNQILERWEWDAVQSYMRTGDNAVLAVRPGGHGDITETHVAWKHDRGPSYVSSPLFYDGRLYLTKDGGFATCYAADSGKLLYEKARLGAEGDYYASPVAAAGCIYASSSRGTVVVYRAGDALEVLSRNVLGEPLVATPAIVGDAIFVRSSAHLWAFAEKPSSP